MPMNVPRCCRDHRRGLGRPAHVPAHGARRPRLAVVALGETPEDGVVVDDTGAYRAWLTELQADVVVGRPDLAVYRTARQGEDVTPLVNGLRSLLNADS